MTARLLWALAALVSLALLASVTWHAAGLGWLSAGRTTTLPPDLRAPLARGDARGTPDLAAISARALFGAPAARPAPDAAPATDPRRLGITLRGVMADSDPARAQAFVHDGQTTRSVRVGDSVADGVTLVAVRAASIGLEVGTDRFVLGFDGLNGGPAEVAAAPADPDAAPPADPMARLRAAIVPGRGSLDLRDAPPPETVDDHIALWRARIVEDPNAVMETIGLERTGQGYRVKPSPNIGVTMAGLRPGDLVTRLNGQTLGDLDSDRALYDAVAAEGFARLEVERSGETLLMTYSLK